MEGELAAHPRGQHSPSEPRSPLRGREWALWFKSHSSYLKANKNSFVLEPNMKDQGPGIQIQVSTTAGKRKP